MCRRLIWLVALAGCKQAIVVEIASDRPIPAGLDHACIGIADDAAQGGQFGSDYALTTLPQTLRVEPGTAESALAWVRGDRGGAPVALAEAHLDFSDDVTIALDTCVTGPAAAPSIVGAPVGSAGALLAASEGAGGNLVVAATPGALTIIDAHDGALVATPGPAIDGTPLAIVAADLDGDCDDDIIVVTDTGPPEVFLRDRETFVAGAPIGSALAAKAIATADVDRDGTTDVVLGGGGSLELWLNNGDGTFTQSNLLTAGGHVTAVSALALGDLNGDGAPDLVVGQSGGTAPMAGWFGEPGGGFTYSADGVIAAVPLDVVRFAMADLDGDLVLDLAVAIRDKPMREYLQRTTLEDHSETNLPQPAATATAIAIGGWDDGCPTDMVVASAAGAPTLRGQDTGVFVADTAAPAATDVVFVDIDDDGDLDAIFATANGVTWFAR